MLRAENRPLVLHEGEIAPFHGYLLSVPDMAKMVAKTITRGKSLAACEKEVDVGSDLVEAGLNALQTCENDLLKCNSKVIVIEETPWWVWPAIITVAFGFGLSSFYIGKAVGNSGD